MIKVNQLYHDYGGKGNFAVSDIFESRNSCVYGTLTRKAKGSKVQMHDDSLFVPTLHVGAKRGLFFIFKRKERLNGYAKHFGNIHRQLQRRII